MKKLMMAAAVSLALASTSVAWADYHDNGGGNDQGDHHDQGGDRHDDHGGGHGRWADEHGPQSFAAPAPYRHPRGYQEHVWQPNEQLPRSYRSHRYAVDYRQYNLQAPPPGQQWVRVDNDFVLTAVATGVVVDVLHNILH